MKNRLLKPAAFMIAFLAAATLSALAQTILVPTNSTWKYLDNGTDQGTAWRAAAFNDGTWASGLTPMGYDDPWIVTTNSYGPDINNKYTTTYYRKSFNVADASSITNLLLRLQRDDGAVVYLNGVEIFRSNLPVGTIQYNTFALAAIGGADESTFVLTNPPPAPLVNGANVLAVEMHQSSTNSSDLSFDLELRANFIPVNPAVVITSPPDGATISGTAVTLIADATDVDGAITVVEFYQGSVKVGEAFSPPYRFTVIGLAPGFYTFSAHAVDSTGLFTDSDATFVTVVAPPPTLVDSTAIWRYFVTPVAAPANWMATGFDDSAWPTGPAELGYGDSDEATVLGFGPDTNNKYPTTYFRRSFVVNDPSAYASIIMTLRYDDGAVIYLNGNEVYRLGMPAGPIAYNTFAVAAADYSDDVSTIATSAFVPGVNVLAVEMHQGSATSSDISFALQLQGILPPSVNISSPANGATFNAPVQFNMTAAASDADGIVTRVDFYDGITLLGTANASPFTIGVSNLLEGVHALTAVATDNSGASATSSPVSITVIDLNPPTLVAASATTNKVTVTFSKTVLGPSATTAGNYTITPAVGVQSAEFGSSQNTIVLTTTASLSSAINYTLTVNNVQGSGGIPIAPNSQIGFQVVGFVYADIGNPTIAGSTVPVSGGVDVTGAGTDIYGTADQFQFSYESDPRVGDFDVKVRVAGLNGSDVWSKAGLMARETLTGASRYAGVFSTPNIGGTFFQYRLTAGLGTTNMGGSAATYPSTWLRLKRAGNLFSGYVSIDGNAWMTLGSFTIPMSSSVYVGLAVTSRDSSKTATGQFRDFGNVSGGSISGLVFDREPLGPSSRRSGLVISEIMYHPKTTNLHEYIEIFNSNPFFEDLSGYSISGTISYTFPPGTVIQGGSFLVLARNPSAFQSVYGISALGPWVGATTNGLSGQGGRVRLRNEARATLIDVNYGTRAPWPVAPDGTGHSLVLARPSYGEADPRAWAASDTFGGSPGRIDPVSADPLRNVVINEFLAHTDAPLEDYIELYNHANQPVNISGAYLSDDPSTNKFRIPNGTVIPARGFISFEASTNAPGTGFALSSTGERIFLINSNQTRVIDAVDFDAQENGVSTGRWPDGGPDFYRLATRSPAAANAAIRSEAVVINEIMYSPISGDSDDEYVELYNRSGSPVNVGRWRFVNGIDFTLPSTTVIPANGYLVVAKNLARLLGKYPNLNTNNTVGSYDGTLANGGERLSLAAPDFNVSTNNNVVVTNVDYHIINEVTYRDGGRWGHWSDGGGSSLELKDPNSDNRQPANWADSNESAKGIWTTVELTGSLGESLGSPVNDNLQIFLLGIGECLVDEVEVRAAPVGGALGANVLSNPGFESGMSGWTPQGSHDQSTVDPVGFAGANSLHLRAASRGDNGGNRVRSPAFTGLGTNILVRAKVKWLSGWPEILFRIHGGTFDVGSRLQIQPNLGTPGAVNSRRVANAGPAIYGVIHSPILPADNEPVVVSARASDPGQTFTMALKYRLDPATTFTTIPMLDNGTGGDAIAGDGVYSATLSGWPTGTNVAFYVEATDSAGGVNTFPQELFPVAPLARMFPLDAPARECVIRWGERTMPGTFATYRLWLTAANTTRWNTRRPVLNNAPSDGTFVYNNYRVIYNMRPQYAGSPWHRGAMQTGPDGSLRVDYDIEFPEDDLFLGAMDFVWNNPGNPSGTTTSDSSAQTEQTSYLIFKEIGVHYNYRRYIHLFVNGNQRSTTSDRPGNFIFEDSQQPNGDVIEQWFPDADAGDLYKIEDWFEFPDNGDDFTNNNDADLQRRVVVTNGLPTLQTSAYRFMWRLRARSAGQSANDYSSFNEMLNAASPVLSGSAPIDVNAINPVLDFEQWMRIFACQHTCGNWDSYGYRRGKNAYTYKPNNGGRFNQWTWDIDFTVGVGGDGATQQLFETTDPRIAAMWANPEILRAYWRAYNDIITGPLQNSFMDPILDAKAAAMAANNINYNPATISTIKSFITGRRAYIAQQLAAGGISNAPFTIRTPLTFSTPDNLVTVTGIANIRIKDILINGLRYPVSWTSVTNWSAKLVLDSGLNTIQVVGGTSTQTMNITYTGTVANPVGSVVFNEIMYNPAFPDASFVEIYNRAPQAFDVSGWEVNGLDFKFANGSILLPGQYMILAKNVGAYSAAYGGGVVPGGVFDGSLDPDGETLTLFQPGEDGETDLVIDKIRYESQAPWPLDAVFNNSSIQLVDSLVDNSRPSAWAAGQDWRQVVVTGSIGSSTNNLRIYLFIDAPGGTVYIDDVYLVEGTTAQAGVNLIQNADFESELSGPWILSTNNVGSIADTAYSHSGSASLKLVCLTTGSASLTRAVTQIINGAIPNNTYTMSFWFLPTAGANNLTIRTAPGSFLNPTINVRPIPATPGLPSAQAGTLPQYDQVWLNEVQPANLTGPLDNFGDREPWVELYNGGPTTVDLSGYYLSDNYTANLAQWQFPAGTTIGAGQYRVIWVDGEPNETSGGSIHTSFRLPTGSGRVALNRLNNGRPQITDYLTYTNLPAGASYGDFPDGQPFNRITMFGATPGVTNIGRSVDIYVNEWMAGNLATIVDPADGDYDDWFELYNAGTNSVDLGGYFLTDDLSSRMKFRIPTNGQYVIPPGGFLLVWADEEGSQNAPSRPDLHASFQLSRGGESIALFAPDARTLIDSVTFGEQTNNVSQGRFPDGTGNISFLTTWTPRGPNSLSGGQTSPNLQSIPNFAILVGQSVNFTAVGSDVDVPAQTLTYSLGAGAPAGATINANTGTFAWTPPGTTTNLITVRVTDNGIPPLTASRTFQVVVTGPTATALLAGSNLQIGFVTVAGKNYRVEFKNSFSDAIWTPLAGAENIVGTGGVVSVNAPVGSNPQRFYRIVQLN